jgi:hypothetical protein
MQSHVLTPKPLNLEILMEDIRGKFDLVLEGHSSLHKCIEKAEQNLNDKISLVDFKVGVLNQKIDAVAADLSTHRRDTEAHPSLYKVKEGS